MNCFFCRRAVTDIGIVETTFDNCLFLPANLYIDSKFTVFELYPLFPFRREDNEIFEDVEFEESTQKLNNIDDEEPIKALLFILAFSIWTISNKPEKPKW